MLGYVLNVFRAEHNKLVGWAGQLHTAVLETINVTSTVFRTERTLRAVLFIHLEMGIEPRASTC